MHHQGLPQLQQLAAGTEINLNPRMLLKQEQVKVSNGENKYRKKASMANKGSESPFNAALHQCEQHWPPS
jgi:hypothetical protein